ncbi:SCO family protein [Methylonatrum kenyense]|uniref:SCO family protein n=1 Tax=Methylonatrum kenyense TaxID=455253 RepID=UPI0020C12C46|nr:SCO family protein [Methylonatrum kenyense]MCK8514862.1 SCO family protein [Methylonatrum kenyense]
MKTSSNAPLLIVAALAGVLALAGGMFAASQLFAPTSLDTEEMTATYLDGGREITDFSLVAHDGQPFDRDAFHGQWNLVFFGFTNCPDICPTTMIDLARVQDGVNGGPGLRTLFITVDPERDTKERLASYVPAFHDSFTGITGDLEQIDRLARDLGIVHVRHNENGEQDYMVDHGSAVLLINPEGRLQAIFQAPHRAADMTRDLQAILDHHAGR